MRSEEKTEEKIWQKRREEGREGISEGTNGSRTSPALVEKPAEITDSSAPESET